MKEKQMYNNRVILILMIVSIVLVPTIRSNSLPGVRLEQIIVTTGILYLMIAKLKNNKLTIHKSIFPLLIVTFGVFMIISSINGALNGYKVIINDFFELYKLYVYSGIFVLTSSLITQEKDKIFILNSINVCILITSIISITQYINLFNLNDLYIPHIAPTQYESLVNNYRWPRVIGLSDNPNVYAVIVLIGCLISLGMYLYNKKKYNLIILVVDFIVLLMTRSRSGFIFFVIASIVFTFLQFKSLIFSQNRNNIKNLLIMFGVLAIIVFFFILAIFILPNELTWRMKEIFDLENSTSWQARLEIWNENYGYFKNHPLLGIGPVKSINYKYAADNEWLLILKRYGIIGTIYLISVFAFPVIKQWKRLHQTFSGKIYISLLVGAVFYMIPAVIFHSFQLMSLVMIIAGMAFWNPKKLYELK